MAFPGRRPTRGWVVLCSDRLAITVFFALLLGASLSPVLLTPIPAMVDYPNHLARMYILSDSGGPDANPYYRVAWAIYPNLAMDLIVPQLARLGVAVELGTRLFLLLSQVLIISGALAIERVVKGHLQISGFVALMFLYCQPFTLGFVNFEFGLGIALWGIALYLAVQERSWTTRGSVNAALVAALFIAHFFALGVYGATLGLHEIWRAWDRKATYRATAMRFVLLAIPVLVVLSIMAFTGGSIGGVRTKWFFSLKWLWPLTILNGYYLMVSEVSVGALLVWIYLAVRRGALRLEPAGRWLAAGFVIIYLAIPLQLFDTSFADFRIIPAAALILSAFCSLSLPTPHWKLATAACVGAITLTNLAVVLFVWTSYRDEYAAVIDSFHAIDKGAMVLIGASGNDPPVRDPTDRPINYAPTLAVHYAKAFVPQLYSAEGKQPLRANPPLRRLVLPENGGPVPVGMLEAIAAGKAPAGTPPFILSWYRDYDYLYMVGPLIANPMPERLEELNHSLRFVLYKIRPKL
jgi:hypothetical protein